MSTINNIGFRGETVEQCPQGQCYSQRVTPNFRGEKADNFEYSEKKKGSAAGVLGWGLVLAAAVIAGLGYTGKAKLTDKLKDGKFKDIAKPVTDTCYKWCKAAKGFGVKCWNWVKNLFSKKS